MTTDRARYPLLLLLVVCFAWMGCGDDNGVDADGTADNTDFSAEATFYFRLNPGAHERLRLEGISGEIRVADAADSDSIVIAGVRRVRSESTEDAQEHLQLLEVTVQDLSTEVFVKTVQPEESHGRGYEVDYQIMLPAALDVHITHVNGQVVLDDIFGDVWAYLVNGQIAGEVTIGAGGAVELTLVNGTINLGIPKTTSAEFSASVVNGYINDSGLVFQDRQSDSNSLSGTLGGGDGEISLAVINGTINVTGLD